MIDKVHISFNSVFMALMLLLSFHSSIASATKLAVGELHKIEQAIATRGSVNVFIEYSQGENKTFQSAGNLERSRIAQMAHARERLINSMSTRLQNRVQTNYSYVPGLLIKVTQSDLDELMASKEVLRIRMDRAYSTQLAESLDIVYPTRQAPFAPNGNGKTIAVLDTGIDKSHSFFQSNGVTRVVAEACFSGNSARPEATSLCPNGLNQSTASGSGVHCSGYANCQHGTHVAGIAAGNGGVASAANLISIQVFTELKNVSDPDVCGVAGGSCIRTNESDILSALEHVYSLRNDFDIAAINMSFGGGEFSTSCDEDNSLVTDMIAQLKSAGIASVAAAGNNGYENAISWPACIDDVIAVGATADATATISGQSVQVDERMAYSNVSQQVDLYAPGSVIYSSLPNELFGNTSGTSMAAPHVSGAFAVLKQEVPPRSVDGIQNILHSAGPTVHAYGVGRKRIDISVALQNLKAQAASIAISTILLGDDD